MPTIDFSNVLTVEAKAEIASQERAAELKNECGARIVEVLDHNTLLNLSGAHNLGLLTADQQTVYALAHQWVRAMQQACRDAISSGDAPVWPDVPEGVTELAEEF